MSTSTPVTQIHEGVGWGGKFSETHLGESIPASQSCFKGLSSRNAMLGLEFERLLKAGTVPECVSVETGKMSKRWFSFLASLETNLQRGTLNNLSPN